MQSEYQRVTRECTLEGLRPELSTAIKAHIERYELKGVLEDALICVETLSTKVKKGMFGKGSEMEMGAGILTPKWLIWAGGKEGQNAGALSARLQDLRVQDYENSKMYQMIEDTGLNVDGFRTGQETGAASLFIGLGPEPAAKKFREMLKDAMTKV